jgi:hypothetical protein
MIFERMNKAFYAYERSMMRPIRWPPTTHDVPTLWERAKALLAAAVETIGSAARLAQRYRFRNADARALNARLRPVEKIVRTLLMIEAATFLLMTPEGARMRREAKLVTPPSPPAPPAAPHSRRIVMPGWHTIAALQPRIDPRVVEREALERAQHAIGIAADLPGKGAPDPLDPKTWRVRLQVIHWEHDKPEPNPASARKSRVFCAVLDTDSHFPITDAMIPRRPPKDVTAPDVEPNALAFARRIEALSRILADPRAAIRQVARRLASMPHQNLGTPYLLRKKLRDWHHGVPEAWNATFLAQSAVRAIVSAARQFAAPPPEPG